MLPFLIWRSAPRGCKASNQLITMLGAATSGKRSSSNGYNAPDALEHFLESYQHDLLRRDEAGVAISLHAIARIYSDEHEYDRARERIREGLPFENLWRHLLTSGEFQDSSSNEGYTFVMVDTWSAISYTRWNKNSIGSYYQRRTGWYAREVLQKIAYRSKR
jgi:hypothetical protein